MTLPRLFHRVAFTLVTLLLVGFCMNQTESRAEDEPRTPAVVRAEGNHLKDESSLYLQQHAHNPIDWYPWGDEALRRAKEQDLPIFLSIGYSSCHWCHVMEEEVFEQDDVATFMNRNFVCIKVDREERPDIDATYMHAVQLITGRGGWPLSVFLTSDLNPFFGGTYFPHDAFVELVHKVHDVYQTQRADLDQQGKMLSERVSALPVIKPGTAETPIDEERIATVASQAEINFDAKYGGFKGKQKFPTPVRWQFLLHYYRKSGDRKYANMTALTLEAMAAGGIYDHVGGGFHRYSTDNKWIVPHFEKMLYDNAQLASLYLEAGAVLERPDFLSVGTDVLDFLIREMRGDEGAFYSSFDADSGGEEGTYYVWTPADIERAVGAEDGPVLAELLRVHEPGNFESNQNVITRNTDLAVVATDFDRDRSDLDGMFHRYREQLRTYRAERVAPGLDRKIVTAWNGLTISALAQAFMVTGLQHYRDAAVQAAAYIWRVHRTADGQLTRASNDGRPSGRAILDDYVCLAAAYLDLFQITNDPDDLSRCIELVEQVRADFGVEQGGWYMTAASADTPIGRRIDMYDSVEPSGNSVMLQTLVRLAAMTGETVYRDDAARTLTRYSGLLSSAALEMSGWFDAASKLAGPYYDVVIAGDPGDPLARELIAATLATVPANAVIASVPAGGAQGRLLELAPALADKPARDGQATAYVCEYGTCQAPTSETVKLRAQMLVGWAH